MIHAPFLDQAGGALHSYSARLADDETEAALTAEPLTGAEKKARPQASKDERA